MRWCTKIDKYQVYIYTNMLQLFWSQVDMTLTKKDLLAAVKLCQVKD